MEASADLREKRYGLGFDVAKSMRYHAYRRGFFDKLDKAIKIITVGTGGATFLILVSGQDTHWAKACALVLSILTAFDVIIGFSNAARVHDKLYRDFALLARDIAKATQLTEADIAEWTEHRLEIKTEEPGTLDWLERRCAREAAEARGAEVDDAWRLPAWKVALSNSVPFWA